MYYGLSLNGSAEVVRRQIWDVFEDLQSGEGWLHWVVVGRVE